MDHNIEIKAKIQNFDHIISKVKELSDSEVTVIKQQDTFFKVAKGRLKIRKLDNDTAEYIFYDRPDTQGPKLSKYKKTELSAQNGEFLTKCLSKCFGVLGIVEKTRQLFKIGQTRIHIDEVVNLGQFIEIEVVLSKDQDVESGKKIADDLLQTLCITEDDLIAGAYIDLLNKRSLQTQCMQV